jgi:hypothetical protein
MVSAGDRCHGLSWGTEYNVWLSYSSVHWSGYYGGNVPFRKRKKKTSKRLQKDLFGLSVEIETPSHYYHKLFIHEYIFHRKLCIG